MSQDLGDKDSDDEFSVFLQQTSFNLSKFSSKKIDQETKENVSMNAEETEKRLKRLSIHSDKSNAESSSDSRDELKLGNQKTKEIRKLFSESDALTSSTEDDEIEFLKFSEKIRLCTTPQSKNNDKSSTETVSNSKDELRLCYQKTKSVRSLSSENAALTSDSEDGELEFLKFSEKVRHCITPQTKNNDKSNTESMSNSEDELSLGYKKTKIIRRLSSESDALTSDSEDDELEFLKFSEKIRHCITPQTKNNKNCSKSESEASLTEFQNSVKSDSQSHVSESTQCTLSADELDFLFPSKDKDISITPKNQTSYSSKLYRIFNRIIFQNKLPGDMHIKWTNALGRTAGKTHCSRNRDEYSCYITLSSKVLTEFDRLRDTLLHEMCHAAVWLVNKITHISHGPLWQTWALRCKMILPKIDLPTRCHNYEIDYPVYYICSNCNVKIGKCRRSSKIENKVCKKCRKPFKLVRN